MKKLKHKEIKIKFKISFWLKLMGCCVFSYAVVAFATWWCQNGSYLELEHWSLKRCVLLQENLWHDRPLSPSLRSHTMCAVNPQWQSLELDRTSADTGHSLLQTLSERESLDFKMIQQCFVPLNLTFGYCLATVHWLPKGLWKHFQRYTHKKRVSGVHQRVSFYLFKFF